MSLFLHFSCLVPVMNGGTRYIPINVTESKPFMQLESGRVGRKYDADSKEGRSESKYFCSFNMIADVINFAFLVTIVVMLTISLRITNDALSGVNDLNKHAAEQTTTGLKLYFSQTGGS